MKAKFTRVLLIALLAVFLFHPYAANSGLPGGRAQAFGPSASRTYWLYGSTNSWNGTSPGPYVNATAGDNVTINLASGDGARHNWYLDYNSSITVGSNPTKSEDFLCKPPSYCRSITFSPFLGQGNYTLSGITHVGLPHGGIFYYRCQYHPTMVGSFKFYAGPVASFTHSPPTPLVGHSTSFDGSNSWPTTDERITDLNWNFGDGNTTSSGSSRNITHVYASNQTFTVVLTITDNASQRAQARGNVTILPAPPIPFDYQIQASPVNSTIFAGQSEVVLLSLSLVSGTPEKVTLSSSRVPSDSGVQASLNVTSGFPSFFASLFLNTTSSSLCVPDPCFLSKTYTVTIIAVSDTGVNHNATFTLVLKPTPSTPEAPNYLLYSLIGTVVAVSVLAALLAFRQFKKRKPGQVRNS